eukprot:1160091-Pelagomonas_calceolata.AAC.1
MIILLCLWIRHMKVEAGAAAPGDRGRGRGGRGDRGRGGRGRGGGRGGHQDKGGPKEVGH